MTADLAVATVAPAAAVAEVVTAAETAEIVANHPLKV